MKRLPREFYTRADVLEVARDLLGKKLVVSGKNGSRVAGIIVETEAYRGPEDRASHAYNGRRTNRTETMYGIGGTPYVYFFYGMYKQFNMVTHVSGGPHPLLCPPLQTPERVGVMRPPRKRRARNKLNT